MTIFRVFSGFFVSYSPPCRKPGRAASGVPGAGFRRPFPGGSTMEIQPQTASADYRPSSDMVHQVQQLQQAGFDDGQVRTLASFVSGVVRDTMRPFIERVEQRFDQMEKHVNQRFDAVDQRFNDMQKRVDQRFDVLEKRVDRVDVCLDGMGQRVGGLEQNLAMMGAKVEAVQRREWVALTMMGLGFAGIIAAIAAAAWVAASAG